MQNMNYTIYYFIFLIFFTLSIRKNNSQLISYNQNIPSAGQINSTTRFNGTLKNGYGIYYIAPYLTTISSFTTINSLCVFYYPTCNTLNNNFNISLSSIRNTCGITNFTQIVNNQQILTYRYSINVFYVECINGSPCNTNYNCLISKTLSYGLVYNTINYIYDINATNVQLTNFTFIQSTFQTLNYNINSYLRLCNSNYTSTYIMTNTTYIAICVDQYFDQISTQLSFQCNTPNSISISLLSPNTTKVVSLNVQPCQSVNYGLPAPNFTNILMGNNIYSLQISYYIVVTSTDIVNMNFTNCKILPCTPILRFTSLIGSIITELNIKNKYYLQNMKSTNVEAKQDKINFNTNGVMQGSVSVITCNGKICDNTINSSDTIKQNTNLFIVIFGITTVFFIFLICIIYFTCYKHYCKKVENHV